MTRTCGRLLSYVAVIRIVSPARTARPAGSEKPVIATGPGSCITGRGSIPPQIGYDVKTDPQLVSVTSTESPPPCRWAPSATITPLSGVTQSACCVYVDLGPPVPGTLKMGSARQFRTSSQMGLTLVRASSTAYVTV